MLTIGKAPIKFQFKKEFKERLHKKPIHWGYGGLSEFTFYRTYSRKKPDGNLETWSDCVIRVIEGMFSILKTHAISSQLPWNERRAHKLAEEAAERLFEFKWTPPGRGLWMMGTDYLWEKGAMALYNPLHEDTKIYLKDKGWTPIKDVEGQEVEVYAKARSKTNTDHFAGSSGYYKATISSAELHKAYEIEVETPNSMFANTYKFIASENHRWFTITNKKEAFSYQNRIETKDLKPGMYLPRAFPRNTFSLDSIGVAHGYFFGDGTRSQGRLHQFTEENKLILTKYFPSISIHDSTIPIVLDSGLQELYAKNLPAAWGRLLSKEYLEDKKYLYSFLAGYFAADGSLGTSCAISSARYEELLAVQNLFENLGIETKLQKDSSNSTNYSNSRDLWKLYINKYALNENFFIKDSHKQEFNRVVYQNGTSAHKNAKNFSKITRVTPIKPLQRVLCATVPGVENFLIEGYTITSNCAFVSTEDMDAEMSKPFAFVMDTMMQGVGCGYDTDGAGKVAVFRPEGEPEVIVVDDTREGWVELISCLIDSYLEEGSRPVGYDNHLVREYGAEIKGFGGVASGPEPLEQGFHGIKEILENRVGELLTSIDIVSIMDIIGKIVVAGNVRRCLPEQAKIMTTDGVKTIRDIQEGDYVVTGGKEYRVNKQVYSGNQKTMIINHRFGKLECTPNHEVAVYTSVGTYGFKLARDIIVGDRLVWDSKGYDGKDHVQLPLPDISKRITKITKIPTVLTTDLAWILGLIVKDGIFDKDKLFLPSVKLKMLDEVNRIFEEIFDISGHISKHNKDSDEFVLKIEDNQLIKWLLSFIKQPAKNTKLPYFIFNANREARFAFLAGLFSSNGGIRIEGMSEQTIVANKTMANEVLSLLATLGIGASLYEDFKNKHSYTIFLEGDTNKRAWIKGVQKYFPNESTDTLDDLPWDFSYPVSWEPSVAVTDEIFVTEESTYYPSAVTSIDVGTIENTYDIEVEGIKQFTTDGIVVHNSALIALGDPNDMEYVTLKNWDKNPVGMGSKAPEEMASVSQEDYDKYNDVTVSWDDKSLIAKKYAKYPWSWKIGGWLWASNNTLYSKAGMSYAPYVSSIAQNGEPGFFWLDTARSYGRLKDGIKNDDTSIKGLNPCVTGDTWVSTNTGNVQVKNLVGTPFTALVNGELYDSSSEGFWSTGIKPVFKLTLENGLQVEATENHQFLLDDNTWKNLKDLTVADKVQILNNKDYILSTEDGREEDEGYFIGQIIGDGTFSPDGQPIVCLWIEKGIYKEDYAPYQKLRKFIDTLPARSDFRNLRTVIETDNYTKVQASSASMIPITSKYGVYKLVKQVPEHGTASFNKGLLQGLFDSDGSIQGSLDKGVSIRLSQSDLSRLESVQRLLLTFGVTSKIYRNRRVQSERLLPDSHRDPKLYTCKAQHELVISKNSIKIFYDKIGFIDNAKQKKLENILNNYTRAMNKDKYVSKVLSITYTGEQEVYDCSISTVHRFSANGIIAHNCGEISLASYETCNLNENYPAHHTDYWDLQRTLKFSYLYSKAVTLLATNWKETNSAINKNRRIGCSMSGIQEAFIKFGRKEFLQWLDQAYDYLNYVDKKYSDWLGVPKSIRKTTVKPSGTVSLLAGALPGVHHTESTSYYRLVRISANSPIVKVLEAANYRIEPAASDPTRTLVVYFPIVVDAELPSKSSVSIWQQFKDVSDLQKVWADNAVSVTVTFTKPEVKQIASCLSAFDSELKSISLLPYMEHGFVQAPYTTAPREEILAYEKTLKPLDFTILTKEGDNAESNKFCSNDSCAI